MSHRLKRLVAAQRLYRLISACVLVLCASALPVSEAPVSAQPSTCLATTASGSVRGALRGGACVYLGVPYAAPPVGHLRWRPPHARAPWAPGTLDATTIPAICPNVNAGPPQGNEDCLTLNLWTPAVVPSGATLPVMVWLHTGGFQAASANFAASDGRRFAEERQAVVIAPNYRVGPLGFLAHSALRREHADYPSSGNYGLADQRAALMWVHQNAAAFGGDPANVTLAGTSAGAVSASLHLASPFTRGLFHRAILQSGQASARWRTSAEAEIQGDQFAAALGCGTATNVLSCLRSASRDQVLQALTVGQAQVLEEAGRVQWGPVVDGFEVLDQPRDLYRRGQFHRIPVIVGTMRDEGWTYVDRSFPTGLDALRYETAVRDEFGMDAAAILRLYPVDAFPTPKDALARLVGDAEVVCEARRVARMLHHDGAPVYMYSFEYAVDAVTPGRAFHGLESNLLFGNNFGAPSNHVLTPGDLAVFNEMSTFWRRFAETGDPNPRGVPVQWPTYRPGPFETPVDESRSDRYLEISARFAVRTHLRGAQCNFWESFNFRTALGAVPAGTR